MAWLETNTDRTADAASAKLLVTQSETTDYLYQHPDAPLKTTVKTEVTLYRGLTQEAATALATSLVKSGDLKVVFYYGNGTVNGEVVAALSGSKTDVQAQRTDETGQWQVTATTATYTPDGKNWSTSGSGSVTTSKTKSASATFCGVAYTPTYHVDFYGHKTVNGTTALAVVQFEATTVTTERVASEPTVSVSETRPVGQVTFGDKDYGQVTKRLGTRIAVSASMLPQNKGWSVTTTTTVFT